MMAPVGQPLWRGRTTKITSRDRGDRLTASRIRGITGLEVPPGTRVKLVVDKDPTEGGP